MPEPSEVLYALRTARDTVAAGWCQGKYFREGEGFCAEGAILQATPSSSYRFLAGQDGGDITVEAIELRVAAYNALLTEVQANYPRKTSGDLNDSIPFWNDAKGRTQDEVLAMFDKAILHLEESA